ncbi:MAG: AAA family ATPase, partial [Candidatus Micrarchaeota archaeon]|nr:AAA family ATPase [Candidatus Micrarchaeota archaeon]
MYLPRELEKELLQHWEEKRIFIIRGPRRSGKTTLLKHLQQIKGGTYISMESSPMLEQFLKDPLGFVKGLEDPIFLDELQYGGEQASKALKQIYDLTDKRIIVSGSGAFDLKTNIQAYLVGRAYIYDLLPLSFREFVEWKMPQFKHLYRPF